MSSVTNAISDSLPISLTHNNDMLDDHAFSEKAGCLHHPRCAACCCSMIFIVPLAYTFFKYVVLLGKIDFVSDSFEDYTPWTPTDADYYATFGEDPAVRYSDEYALYDDEGLTSEMIQDKVKWLD